MDMAPNIIPERNPEISSRPRTNLRNPLPLSSTQEAEVRNLYYKRVRTKCADEIKEFADCARGRTVSVTWMCKTKRLAMNSCMVSHATPAEEDAAREEWFAGVEERRRKRLDELDAVEKRRYEVIDLIQKQEEKEKKQQEEKKASEEKSNTTKRGWWR